MEGPSLYLAKNQLKPFKNKEVLKVTGNTKIGKERLLNKEIRDIFAWGKHLVFQCDTFAMKVHFLLFGTFEAEISGKSVTGDYRRARVPRLELSFSNGKISMFNCSVKFIEDKNFKNTYDFSIDIMSRQWDSKKALENLKKNPNEEIADILLDQNIFAGVGNIIKNEVLSILKINPRQKISEISLKQLEKIVAETYKFSRQFLKWRKVFKLRANLKAHRKSKCPHCGEKMKREKTGKKKRWSYYCPLCQSI
jgi:endonuclease VIII